MKTKACQFNLRKIRSVLSFVITALVFFASTPAFSQETIIYAEGFENNNGNYTKIIEPADPQFPMLTGDGLWEWGTPGWISAHSGSMCWGTNFAGDMPKSTSSIVSPAISLASYNSSTHTARVSFWAQTDISMTGANGRFYVSSDGSNFTKLANFYMSMAGGWNRYEFDVSSYIGGNLYLKFYIVDKGSNRGFYVDDISVSVFTKSAESKILTLEANESSNGSCPWIYTWNGSSYVANNDIYSTARFVSGKYRDYLSLSKPLVAENEKYKLQLNEAASDESFTDYLKLQVVDHAADVNIATDNFGNIFAYKPANLIPPVSATSNTGISVLDSINKDDQKGFNAYSQDYVEVDFGNVDISNGARMVLKIKGFLTGTGISKPFVGPPAIVVQSQIDGVWKEVGRMYPRFEWDVCAFDVSTFSITQTNGVKVRLFSISHDLKYTNIDFVAIEIGAEPAKTVSEAPFSNAFFSGNSVINLLNSADNQYLHLLPGNHMNLEFDAPLQSSPARSFIFTSEGYYIPKGGTFFVATWDGSAWIIHDAYSFSVSDETKTFDLSLFLPDPDNEMKVRIWQDYAEGAAYPANIDFIKFQQGSTVGTLSTATDVVNNISILSQVNASDDIRFALHNATYNRNRWSEYKWTGLTINSVPVISGLNVSGNTISWVYSDPESDPQQQSSVQVWSGTAGTGTLLWGPSAFTGTSTSVTFAGDPLVYGNSYYLRVKAYDGNNWSQWVEYQFTSSMPAAPGISTAAISSITATSAISGGTVSSHESYPVTERGVCWNTTGTPTYSDSKTSDGTGTGSFISSITGLSVSNTYYVRAYATNSIGTRYGTQLSIIYTSPAVTTTAISSVTSTSATSGGNVTSYGGSSVTARGVCWNTTGTPTIADNLTSDGTGTGSYTSSITGLSVSNTYYVRAYATNSSGTSYGSQLSIIYTRPAVTTAAIPSVTATSATSGGNVTNDGGSSVTARGVCWNTTGTPTIANNLTSDGTGTGSYTSSITGLTLGTAYYVRAYATNLSGTSYGSQLSFIASPPLPTSCIPPTSIKSCLVWIYRVATTGGVTNFYNASACSASYTDYSSLYSVSKTPGGVVNMSFTSSYINGKITYTSMNYSVWIDFNNNGIFSTEERVIAYTNSAHSSTVNTSFTVPIDATPGQYRMRVRGDYSTTPSDPCAQLAYGETEDYKMIVIIGAPTITTTAISDITSTSATSGGNVTNDGGSSVTARGVCWNITGTPIITDNLTSDGTGTGSYTSSITGLTANTLYYVRAYATNSIGTAYGNEVSFTPLKNSQTVTFDPLPTKTFGDSDFSPVASASSGLAVTFSSSNTDVATIVSSNIHIAGAGTAVITASQEGDATWLPASATQIFTADKSDQTITFDAIPAKTYGNTDMDLLASATSGLTIDYSSDNTAVVTIVSGKIHITGAGTANIAANQSGNANYNAATEVIQILTVSKAMITVASDPKTKIYGSANPALTIQYSGFINGDDAIDLTAAPTASTAVSNTTNVGVVTDAITIGGGVDENYDFTYVADDFTVTKATLTVTADNQIKTYGEVNPALTIQYSGFVNGDDATDLNIEPVASTTVGLSTTAGEYANSLTLSGGSDDNYDFSYEAADFIITKGLLTATADEQFKVYGSDNPGLTISWAGFKNNDEVSVIDELPLISTLALKTGDIGIYDITITGGSDNNYDLNLVNGSLEIDKAPLVIIADDKAKIYLEPNPELTFTWSGFVLGQNQDVIDVVPVLETVANKNSDAGTYDIIASGGIDGNYSFTYENGILTINKANQVITFEEIPAGLRMTQELHLNAEATSGLSITFETSNPIIGSIYGALLSVNKEGNLTITASQPGNQNWNPAPDVSREIVTLPTFDNINSLFTPNNDGMNDYWYIPDLEKYGQLQVTVYNRFGQKVYASDGYKNDWDGTWNGYPLPSASYYYIMKSSTKGFIKGVVNLVR